MPTFSDTIHPLLRLKPAEFPLLPLHLSPLFSDLFSMDISKKCRDGFSVVISNSWDQTFKRIPLALRCLYAFFPIFFTLIIFELLIRKSHRYLGEGLIKNLAAPSSFQNQTLRKIKQKNRPLLWVVKIPVISQSGRVH